MKTNVFTNQYSLSKTLRFELIPQGKTLEHIQCKGLLEQDNNRAISYQKVKKIIDEYHKVFIESSLKGLKLIDLQVYADWYQKRDKDEVDKKAFEKVKEGLRKQIALAFTNQEKFKNLFAKELIKEDLLLFVSEEDKSLVNEFKDFTTYFTGFHENRKNMYVADEKSTAIAYRLINENLPKYIDNRNIFLQIQDQSPSLIAEFNKGLMEMEEIIQGKSLDDIFTISFFNETITQRGIELYNIIIGGRTADEGKSKIKGINEYINLFNQQQKDKRQKLPKFKQLYKQILSDRNSVSFVLDNFENDNHLLESLEQFYQSGICHYESDGNTIDLLNTIRQFLNGMDSFDLSKVYFRNDTSLTDISQKIFGDWNIIRAALGAFYEINHPLRLRERQDKFEERKENWITKTGYFDINTLQLAIDSYDNEIVKEKNKPNCIVKYLGAIGKNEETPSDLVDLIKENYTVIKDLLNNPYSEDEKLGNAKEQVAQIKVFLESLLNLIHFVKPFNVKNEGIEKDESFYSIFTPLYEQLSEAIPLYNKVRNYLTQKNYDVKKIKLNFESPTLLNGWPINNEIANSCILLKKDENYFLGLLDKDSKRKFNSSIQPKDDEGFYLKMFYNQAADPSKDVQNLMVIDGVTCKKNGRKDQDGINRQLEQLKDFYLPEHINRIRKDRSFSKASPNFSVDNLTKFIEYYKQRTIEYFNSFKFEFKTEYTDFGQFTDHINSQAYQIYFEKISKEYIDSLVEEGKMYLFQIYNKDFSPFSKGTPNMHTLYWKMLFDETNLKNVVYKLNGEAEVFYRKSSIKENNKIIHKANEPILSKNELNKKRESRFAYDIIKDRRFTLDKFQFHVPITMNFKATGSDSINSSVNQFLKNNPDVNIIGLDRGERHLIYYSLINQKGEIQEQGSLNEISNEKQSVNYKDLLVKKEGDRTQSRKDWNTIENIKEIKEGYLSQVVHKIATLMVEKNAVVVMEDLNMGFMRGRQKVERQVYQKLEKMLIDKLNYLVFKNRVPNEPGGVLKALQLTSKFESFKSMGKQSGFLFYVPAWNTSKIDPTTGFVDFLKPKYESIEKSKNFFSSFNSIRFNNTDNYFEFEFDYGEFNSKAEDTRTKWTVCTHSTERYTWNKKLNIGKGAIEKIDITQNMQLLLDEAKIPYAAGNNLISDLIEQTHSDFFKTLTKLLSITLSLRHSNGQSGEAEKDFILSPVKNEQGVFFNSNDSDTHLPKDADANGAFHIALKGLWVLHQINEAEDMRKIKMAITNKEWLQFVQKKLYKV